MKWSSRGLVVAVIVVFAVGCRGRHPRCCDPTYGMSPAQLAHFNALMGPTAQERMDRLERLFRKHVDPRELTEWAKRMAAINGSSGFESPPVGVASLEPDFPPAVLLETGGRVRVVWGGGFGHWGLFIYSDPADRDLEVGRFQRPFADGVTGFVGE